MRYWSAVVVLLVCACGGESATGPSYADISGRYGGELNAVTQNTLISGVVSLVMTQANGSTSGTTEMNGFIGAGPTAPAFADPGTVVGVIGTGVDPTVTVTITSTACPAHTTQFAGNYQTANKRLVLHGTVELYSSTCAVAYSFPYDLLLSKP